MLDRSKFIRFKLKFECAAKQIKAGGNDIVTYAGCNVRKRIWKKYGSCPFDIILNNRRVFDEYYYDVEKYFDFKSGAIADGFTQGFADAPEYIDYWKKDEIPNSEDHSAFFNIGRYYYIKYVDCGAKLKFTIPEELKDIFV